MTRKEKIDYLMANKSDIIQMKKAALKSTDAIGCVDSPKNGLNISKALHTSKENDTEDVIKRTIIGNSYLWMDSHDDVHLESTFTKSLKERSDKVLHLHDHIYQLTAKVGKPTSVYEKSVKWSDLGVDKSGSTVVLMMDSDIIKDYNPLIFDQYKSKQIDQHSVGMYYVKIDFAVDDSDYPEAQKVYLANIDKIGNRDRVEEQGYFYAVSEAKLVEISAVLEGSNELTPTIDAKNIEPSEDTHKSEPSEDTLNLEREEARKKILLNFIKN